MPLSLHRVRAIAFVPLLLLTAWPAAADGPVAEAKLALRGRARHLAALGGGRTGSPLARNSLGVEFAATALVEAWNLNERREWLAGGSVAIWWAFLSRASLVVEVQGMTVFQSPGRNAFVGGLAPLLRWRVRDAEPWTAFVELGPGISWSDTNVPPRGTRFNYLAIIGGGITHRLGGPNRLIAGVRWLHLSNGGREGRTRNPDIQSLGPYLGLQIAF